MKREDTLVMVTPTPTPCSTWGITVTRPDHPGLAVPVPLRQAAEAAEAQGKTVVLAGWDGQASAVLVVADQVKPHAAEAVARIRRLGIRPLVLQQPSPYESRATVPLTLTFRHSGTVTIDAPVTGPGTP
jgi:GAF domain-containing protein